MIAVHCNHSADLGAVRHQGLRPTCMAFAASDLNAFANSTGHLSVEFLCHHSALLATDWKPDRGFTTDETLGAIATPGQPLEESYPYRPDEHGAPLDVPPTGLSPLISSATRARNLPIQRVFSHLSSGDSVGLVVAVTKSLFYPSAGIVAFDPLVLPDQYHALVGVGVGTHSRTGERHMLVRNSWGPRWGIDGHAWVPERHLALHLDEGFLV